MPKHRLSDLPSLFGGHSGLVPLLPIPNRTVKRTSADDSTVSRVKVGHRQTLIHTPCLINHRQGVSVCGGGRTCGFTKNSMKNFSGCFFRLIGFLKQISSSLLLQTVAKDNHRNRKVTPQHKLYNDNLFCPANEYSTIRGFLFAPARGTGFPE